MRAMILGAVLAALAACSTEGRLLTPDPEAGNIVSPEGRSLVKGRDLDPVCGASLEHADFAWESSYQGADYYFDSEECRKQFDANPELYRMTAR